MKNIKAMKEPRTFPALPKIRVGRLREPAARALFSEAFRAPVDERVRDEVTLPVPRCVLSRRWVPGSMVVEIPGRRTTVGSRLPLLVGPSVGGHGMLPVGGQKPAR
jgi:hypothetical protein